MSRFKDILKQLQEDRLLKNKKLKEDDGGGIGVGDVSAPTSDATDSDMVAKHDGAVTYDEIIGKCNHKKDGFFGPGCMHRPYNIFSKILTRIPKKKKKYIKVLDLTESDEFSTFKGKAQSIIQSQIEKTNEYLKKLNQDLNCRYEEDYDFSDEKENWVAAIDKDNQDSVNSFGIALNLPALYEFLDENGLAEDDNELCCQIQASIWHEVAHGIIQYLKDTDVFDMELTDADEEIVAEEFSNYMLRDYTSVNSSKLNDYIEELSKSDKNQ